MLNFEKTYKMVLTDDEGNTYKSDNARLMNVDIHNVGPEELYAEIMVSAPRLIIEMNGAATPSEMPTAEVAAKASQIIQMENRKKSVEKEWLRLTNEVCKAIKAGDEKIYFKIMFEENKMRLKKMGYHLVMTNPGTVEFRISWGNLYEFTS